MTGSASAGARRAVAAAVSELRAGHAVLLVHEFTRTGHLIASARHVTEETVALIDGKRRGVLRAAMTAARMEVLGVQRVASSPADGRLYAPPVDLAGHDRPGSASDRVATARALASAETGVEALVIPGHIFPVEVDRRGCLAVGQAPEAAYDLARLAGDFDVGLYADLAEPSEVLTDNEARDSLGRELGTAVVSIRDLIIDREHSSVAARRIVSAELPTPEGALTAIGYRSNRTEDDYIAFVHGELGTERQRAYLHSRCPISDVFGGLDCGCGERLRGALAEIRDGSCGVIIYSDHDSGKHLGHLNPPPHPREYPGRVVRPSREREVAAVLSDLGVRSVELSSNEQVDVELLEALGVGVTSYRGSEHRSMSQEAFKGSANGTATEAGYDDRGV